MQCNHILIGSGYSQRWHVLTDWLLKMFMEIAQNKPNLPSSAAGTMLTVCSHSVLSDTYATECVIIMLTFNLFLSFIHELGWQSYNPWSPKSGPTETNASQYLCTTLTSFRNFRAKSIENHWYWHWSRVMQPFEKSTFFKFVNMKNNLCDWFLSLEWFFFLPNISLFA